MKKYTLIDLNNALKEVGLKKGQTVFVCPEIYKFGELDDVKNINIFKKYLQIILKILGKNGTIVMNTYTFNTLRYNQKFNYYDPFTTSGTMSQELLKFKGSLRSNHPVFSVGSIGKHKKEICKDNSISNYGFNSPYDKMLKLNCKILNLGQNYWLNPFLHVAEFNSGVPYCYNKFTKIYFKKKSGHEKLFSSFVRYKYLKLNYNFNNFKKILLKKKIIKSAKLGSGKIYMYSAQDFYFALMKKMSQNAHFLLKNIPIYKREII